ncbi:beta-galactosidase isoform X1 [Procambarus clarkii]|uniref:beta-galactosidase isoform X1 n=1 Tax=Procambarus clarkii TaxID=6728 RepID=UPI00374444D4
MEMAAKLKTWTFFILCLVVIHFTQGTHQEGRRRRTFKIDYANDRFLKDGLPFRYVSGSIHYFRVPASLWADRLWKLRMAGFNAVQTVVEWSSHEPEPGVLDFSGNHDLEAFITAAQDQDLLVILRVGPFICAERDMGGFPYWLLRLHPNIRLRSSDPAFLRHVDAWLGEVLLPKVKPLLYENGGPIIMVQVENEYGSSSNCDFQYTAHLREVFRQHLGPSVVLFTVDSTGSSNLRCGKIPDVYATVDFGLGTDPNEIFGQQRLFEPRGPLVNSEFYPGWIDHWGEPHHKTDAQELAGALDAILALNASVNMYMFHGGTNFAFTAGSNMGRTFQTCPTSYDYDAPVSEAGDPTEKYHALRQVISKYLVVPLGPVPPVPLKARYGEVKMEPLGSVMQLLSLLRGVTQPWPLTFEQLHLANGIVVYHTVLRFRVPDPARLSVNDVHDRGYVFVEGRYVGLVSREQELYDVAVTALPGHTLVIMVESQGRVSVGPRLNDFKGLTANVTINNHVLKGWTMTPLPLTDLTRLRHVLWRLHQTLSPSPQLGTPQGGMTFYRGTFNIPAEEPHPLDTFLRLDGWAKGVAWVNDVCLGRYWPEVGPQVTLYVPRSALTQGTNTLLLLELEASPCHAPCPAPCSCPVSLVDTHQVDGPTPP